MTSWILRACGPVTGAARRGRLRAAGALAAAVLLLAVAGAGATRPRGELDLGDDPSVFDLRLSPDGKTLAVLDLGDRSVTLWDARSREELASLKTEDWEPYRTVAFTPDGRSVMADGAHKVRKGGADAYRPSVAVWDARTYALSRIVDLELDASDQSVGGVFTPDGKSLLVGTRSFGVWVFDLATGKQTGDFQLDERPQIAEVASLVLAPDGKTLTVGTKASVFVCDLGKGKTVQKIPWRPDLLLFSPDGKRLLAADRSDRSMQVWDPATGKNLDTLWVPSSGCTDALAFSPDGRTLAMGGGGVALWDVGLCGVRDDFTGRPRGGLVHRLLFTPDGKTLITASLNKVEFWDVPPGTPKSVQRGEVPAAIVQFPAYGNPRPAPTPP